MGVFYIVFPNNNRCRLTSDTGFDTISLQKSLKSLKEQEAPSTKENFNA